jgi:hypothetical protein
MCPVQCVTYVSGRSLSAHALAIGAASFRHGGRTPKHIVDFRGVNLQAVYVQIGDRPTPQESDLFASN